MIFNSLEFFLFFTILYCLYRLLPFRGQNYLLLAAGYVFYGWWDVRFLFLIAFSTTVDFCIGCMLGTGKVPRSQRIKASLFLIGASLFFVFPDWGAMSAGLRPPQFNLDWRRLLPCDGFRNAVLAGTILFVAAANLMHQYLASLRESSRHRALLFITVAVNLGFLGFFKYFNFFVGSAEEALRTLGFKAEMFHLNVILPVGISFYTFQSLSYTIDVYRGLITPTLRLSQFALFVAYFAPMVAGPIERARHLLPQLLRPRTITLERSLEGIYLVLLGLFKKVAIADGIAPAVNSVYASTGAVSGLDVSGATLLFAIQIYCDFSGYSDIAIGVSRLLGIELSPNFNLPYFSRNPSEFWRRWHISLSTWLRDYLYIPLGGNRRGPVRTYINLMVTMVLGGLWHGAAWNYVLWGFYQGLLLCVHRAIVEFAGPAPDDSTVRTLPGRLKDLSMRIVFFVFVCYGWLLFRSNSLSQIVEFTRLILGLGPAGVPSVLQKPVLAALAGIPVLLLLHVLQFTSNDENVHFRWSRPARGALYAALIFILIMGTSNAPVQFIYFQF